MSRSRGRPEGVCCCTSRFSRKAASVLVGSNCSAVWNSVIAASIDAECTAEKMLPNLNPISGPWGILCGVKGSPDLATVNAANGYAPTGAPRPWKSFRPNGSGLAVPKYAPSAFEWRAAWAAWAARATGTTRTAS